MGGEVKRVLILWADRESANFGVRVLAEGTASLARAAWGDSIEIDWQDSGQGDSDVCFRTRSIASDLGRRTGLVKSKLRQYDVVIDTGAGDSFTDIYGFKRLARIVYVQRVANRLGIPVAMGPQTVGPFDSSIGRFAARRCLSMRQLVLTRDPASAQCAEQLGRKADSISTDVVFSLPEAELGDARDVVINISGLLWSGNKHVDAENYRSRLLDLVAQLEHQGRDITLLAHVVAPRGTGKGDDDVYAIQEFKKAYGTDFDTIVPTTLEQVRSTLSGANVLVGSRMHACLNALSCGTPAIAWSYSRKFAPLMRDIGWEHVLDIVETATDITAQTLSLLSPQNQAKLREETLAVRSCAHRRLSVAVAALQGLDLT